MYVSKDSMWWEIWKILQNFWGTKHGLNKALVEGLKFWNVILIIELAYKLWNEFIKTN
jgi:hypothetical protein